MYGTPSGSEPGAAMVAAVNGMALAERITLGNFLVHPDTEQTTGSEWNRRHRSILRHGPCLPCDQGTCG